MGKIKSNIWLIISILFIVILYIYNRDMGKEASILVAINIKTVGMILPPIFVLIGLLDTWVPKETMVKYMGNKSGILGVFLALFMGAMGAGPLYVAFPVAAILIKKGARLAYVFIFLSAWVSVKLPIIMYEWASLGGAFTIIHVGSSTVVYIVGSFLMEYFIPQNEKNDIEKRAEEMSA